MKCTNCGAELNGKFCTNCGTPAPVEETPVANVPTEEPMVTPNTEFPTFENMPLQSNAMPESTPLSYQSEPVNQTSGSYPSQPESNNFGSYSSQPESMPQSGDFNSYQSTPQTPDSGTNPFAQPAQSELPVNNGYTGQQFTNVPNTTTAQNGKKKMSGGKIAIIVIAIVLGVLLLLGIVVGVIIWNFVQKANESFNDFSSEFSSALAEELEDYDFDEDYNFDDYSMIEPESNNEFVYDGTNLYDYVSETEEFYTDYGWQYVIDPVDKTKAIIVGLNMYMAEDEFTGNDVTITVPDTVDGFKVEEIYSIFVYNPSSDDLKIKLVVPGHIKTIHNEALDYAEECLVEVVFEEGVESIGTEALFLCEGLKKVTVPESVKLIGEKAIGYTYDEDYNEVRVKDFVLVTKKGSTADLYATKNNLKVEYK